ncbi:23S rRNA (pseudouridine(1915)-N(3))-methyltransferase RlmH [Gammaproteobacteria bacterium]|nr:23S rRNA (pseudouridine(1915)-N(3))-methyltransferase RlmH [Gammaproteobacteria bacterium]
MHIRLLAIGDRQPSWVDDAFDQYAGRLPPQWKFRLDQIATARRSRKMSPQDAKQAESEQILARIDASEQVVLLDERGQQMTSPALAARFAKWQADGRDLCCVIGGPDGVTEDCRSRADFVWSLSSLTLPHGLARVLFAEQLYRAWSLQSGHPYHRE